MKMEKIPTAAQFFEDWCNKKKYISIDQADDIEECLIDFAKLHRKAILEAAADNATLTYRLPNDDKLHGKSGFKFVATKESILNAYPESNII